MKEQAFKLIVDKTGAALEAQGYEKSPEVLEEEEGDAALFTSENTAYSVFYNNTSSTFELRSTNMTDDGPNQSWTSLSHWIFNPEEDTMREAESIANDFVEIIEGPARIAAMKKTKKQTTKDEDHTPGPLSFYRRLAQQVFPDLKDEINEERVSYESFRSVTFCKEHVMSRIETLATKKKESAAFRKMVDLLDEFYRTGDKDVRSIITMVIFNGMNSQAAVDNILAIASKQLKSAQKHALRLKGKTVKPEAPPKSKVSRGLMAGNDNAPKRL